MLEKKVVVDVSRHTAALKVLGMVLVEGSSLDGLTPVLITSGRVSSDMARALSLSGIRIVATPRHALISGAVSADSLGITLISKDRDRSLKVITHPERVRGAPPPPSGPGEIRWMGETSSVC